MRRKRSFGGWLFLASVMLVHVATALAEPGLARQALSTFVGMLRNVAPVLVLVIVLMFLAELFLTPQQTRSWLGRGSGLSGWLTALGAGILSTGPVYTWYALLAELRANGMRVALVAVVLYARAIKLPLLPLLAHYFGAAYALVLSGFIAVFAILNGLAVEILTHRSERE